MTTSDLHPLPTSSGGISSSLCVLSSFCELAEGDAALDAMLDLDTSTRSTRYKITTCCISTCCISTSKMSSEDVGQKCGSPVGARGERALDYTSSVEDISSGGVHRSVVAHLLCTLGAGSCQKGPWCPQVRKILRPSCGTSESYCQPERCGPTLCKATSDHHGKKSLHGMQKAPCAALHLMVSDLGKLLSSCMDSTRGDGSTNLGQIHDSGVEHLLGIGFLAFLAPKDMGERWWCSLNKQQLCKGGRWIGMVGWDQ